MNSSTSLRAIPPRDITDMILSRLSDFAQVSIHGFFPSTFQIIDDVHNIFDSLSTDDTSIFVITFSTELTKNYLFNVTFSEGSTTNARQLFLLSGFATQNHACNFLSDFVLADIQSCEHSFISEYINSSDLP